MGNPVRDWFIGTPLGQYFLPGNNAATFPGKGLPVRQSPPPGKARDPLEQEPAGSGPLPVQGTRVASPEQGTQGGPKQAPTVTTFGPGPSATIDHTLSQTRGWPPNPARVAINPPGDRSEQIKTDYELNTGPAPGRVIRQMFERQKGAISESGYAFPWNADWAFIPHQNVPREAQSTGPLMRTTDDATVIPAVFAGNPRT